MLFLSYAGEDDETAREIADWFDTQGLEVYLWQDHRSGQFIEEIETSINKADAFLALMSPNFLASPWCRRERELAMFREKELRVRDPAATFIHVLKVKDTAYAETGFLRSYDWLDLTAERDKERTFRDLADRLRSSSPPDSAASGIISPSGESPFFRNRRDELNKVLGGLTNASGPHFWLMIAPPQLGKTWFLDRLSAEIAETPPQPSHWVARMVDLREQPLDVRSNAGMLLAQLFGRNSSITIESNALRNVAQEISQIGRPYLCLLDSAELLKEDTAVTVRRCLSQIYNLVQRAGNINVRLGLVVASRREDEWRGVFPHPGLSPLALTEFKEHIVQQALRDLAYQMGRTFEPSAFAQNATLVHHLSEGLPALLVRCLQWVRIEQFLELERLEEEELFAQLAHPYVQEGLLSQDSLFPWGRGQIPPSSRGQLGEPRRALDSAFRVLAPYRLFTQSHLRHHFDLDPDLRSSLENLGWPIEDLWKAISATALLKRPLNEPWQEIHGAIRKLLYRYYYRSDEDRAKAHREARNFVEIWADKQTGTEQVVGLVECLWHDAALLRLTGPRKMVEAMTESGRRLSQALSPSPAFTATELREYAAERMRNDEEFEGALRYYPGLFDRLVAVVLAPSQES
jgi:hypothetical protein